MVCLYVYKNLLSGRYWTRLHVEHRSVAFGASLGMPPEPCQKRLGWERLRVQVRLRLAITGYSSASTPSMTLRSVRVLYDMKRYQFYLFMFTSLYALFYGSYILL